MTYGNNVTLSISSPNIISSYSGVANLTVTPSTQYT